MDLQTLLQERNLSPCHLSKISGIPKTTILDICSGKIDLSQCSAQTVLKLARALDCTAEEIMTLDRPGEYDEETGRPVDPSYLECGLPEDLYQSIRDMVRSWEIVDAGGRDFCWDTAWCNLNADINAAEVDQLITPEQAWYLREKYLRMSRNG